jgi:2-oxoglutarate dehydrogenase E2 component (dihydrolipoamide succinyltransferase)
MADVTLPQLGETVTEGTITQWFKAVGDTVEVDETLFEVSTDKVDSEVPSPASGVLTKILVPEGETVDVGTVIAIVSDAADADASAPADAGTAAPAAETSPTPAPEAASIPPEQSPAPAAPAPAAAPAAAPAPAAVSTPEPDPAPEPAAASPSSHGASPLLSPVVRQLVSEHGLDPSTIEGTGPGGRITRSDVQSAAEQAGATNGHAAATTAAAPAAAPPAEAAPVRTAPAAAAAPAPEARPAARARPVPAAGERDTVEPFNTMRRLTAEHMVHSKAVAPHVLMTSEVDYERVEVVRRRHGDAFRTEEGFGLNYLPFISLAVVDAIREYPKINASMGDAALIVHHDINLGIAVDLNHEGLIVPVVHQADGLRLRAIGREVRALGDRARSGDLSADDITGGTFTVSNPGPFGTLFTGAIISQPQVAILSTDGVSRKPVVVTAADGSEAIAIHSVGLLALSFDHRAFDGAYAAAFLARVREIIETRDWEAELA